MSSEKHVAEVEVRVRMHGQEDATICREYTSPEECSTDGIAGEVWAGVSDTIKARMSPVNSEG